MTRLAVLAAPLLVFLTACDNQLGPAAQMDWPAVVDDGLFFAFVLGIVYLVRRYR